VGRVNPFDELYEECNTGTNQSQLDNLPDIPSHIDIEITNACNFRCLMCPTGNYAMQRATGIMLADTHHKIVRQCAEHGIGLRYIGYGEPMQHPMFLPFMQDAKAHEVLVHVNTNGSYMNRRLAHELCDIGLDSIKFSFQGVDRKSYEAMRRQDFFDGLYDVMGILHRVRGRRDKPFIHASTTITTESQRQVQLFRDKFKYVADRVTVGHTTFDYFDVGAVRISDEEKAMLEDHKMKQTVIKRHPTPCPEVFHKLSISWDGSGSVCCNDYDNETHLGTIHDLDIPEMWQHIVITEYRKRLAKDKYEGVLCGNCWDYMSLTHGAKNDRGKVSRESSEDK